MFLKLLKLFFKENKKTIIIRNKKIDKKNNKKSNILMMQKNKLYVFVIILFAIIILYSKALFVIPLFIILAALSRLSQNLMPFVSGFDLCLFLTVIAGVTYGSVAGIIVGVGSGILGAIIKNTRNVGEKMIFYIAMGLVGILAAHIPLTNILYVGLISTIFYDMIIVFVYFGMIKKCILNATTFTITHIIFNWWLFSTFGVLLQSIL